MDSLLLKKIHVVFIITGYQTKVGKILSPVVLLLARVVVEVEIYRQRVVHKK
jgi:hypothetical protein